MAAYFFIGNDVGFLSPVNYEFNQPLESGICFPLCMANYQSRGDYGLNLFSTVPFAGALLGFRVVDR